MTEKKYKIQEFAKDFALKSAAVIEMLTKLDDTPRKSTAALSTDELDWLFDRMTVENEAADFNAYFAMKKPEPVVEETPAEETPAEPAPAQEAKPAQGKPAPEKKGDGKAPQKPAQPGKPAQQQGKGGSGYPQGGPARLTHTEPPVN